MKNISLWALTNPWKAQIIITVVQILLAFIAIYSGVWLFAHDIIIPSVFANIGLAMLFLALILYPIRRSKYAIWKMSFGKQKLMDSLMLLGYMVVVITISNQDARSAWNEPVEDQISQNIVLDKYNVSPKKQKKLSRKEKRSIRKKLKKEFKAFVKERKRAAKNDSSNGGALFGVFLFTLLLMALVAALACSAACSGANAIGLGILIGGWIAAIAIGINWTKNIKAKKKDNYQPSPSD